MSDSIQQLIQRLQQFADARDWGQFHSPKNLASALIVEAGELLEHFQWMSESQSRELNEEKKQQVAYEMADVLLYLIQLSSALNIDLLTAAKKKMALNEQKYPVDLAKGNSRKYSEN
ncbi:nucleotide pyrophosphohydrolase [Variovorax terrae]|uniref:Nucleotide pyrophosphohydrolase n=1 Tax=Variovorax terrae TaxID=2923278 RepID=A0A9X1W0X3_9BURK|nr:nucleotide pyrophosphohydrolase [Variovorax terrae]MCJ0765662.1 nucleotide pyrophosphohydrolase [Variovorax terrae]